MLDRDATRGPLGDPRRDQPVRREEQPVDDIPVPPGRLVPRVVTDTLVTVFVIAGSAAAGEGHGRGPSFGWVGAGLVAVHVALAVVLLFRRRAPFVVLGVVAVTGCVLAATEGLTLGALLAVVVATFTAVDRSSRRTGILVTTAVAVTVTAASLVHAPWGLQIAAFVAAAGAAGDATRSRREYIEAVTERAVRAERTKESEARRRVAEERLAIARDLHDVVAHQVAVVNLHAATASAALPDRPEDAERALATIRHASRTVLSDIGELLAGLRETRADEGPQAPTGSLDSVAAPFVASGLDVTWRTTGEPVELPPATSVVAARVVQEALTNAHKHGADGRAHVHVEHLEDAVRLTVTSPVAPLGPPRRPADGAGHGLLGMRERVELVHGTVTHGPVAPGSWQVVATLPVTGVVGGSAAGPEPAGDAEPFDPEHVQEVRR